MGAGRKRTVREFYTSDFYINPDSISNYLHPEAELIWNTSSGRHEMKYVDIEDFSRNLSQAFDSLRAEVTHLFREKDWVTIRLSYFVKTVENPDEELPLVHLMAIWELKDNKLYKGFQISQSAEDSPEEVGTFL